MVRVLVLCGGQSPEHAISIRSCKNILSAIDRDKYAITLIGINKGGEWRLVEEGDLGDSITSQGSLVEIRPGRRDSFWSHGESLGYFEVAFPVLHGPNGEDGSIQGLFQLLGLPCVGTGLLASSVAMDKDVSKCLLRDAGIRVADWISLRKADKIPSYKVVTERLGEPLFVKPANMGSSVGVHRVTTEEEWQSAINDAFLYDTKVLVEESITARELECAILGNQHPKATGVGEVQSGDFYSFDEKYSDLSKAEIVIPAAVDSEDLTRLKETALATYKVLGCKGLSRVDMFLTANGTIYVNEVNTMPGFTSISMYPKLWEQEGFSYTLLIDRLIDLARED